eukprot:gene13776-15846_t
MNNKSVELRTKVEGAPLLGTNVHQPQPFENRNQLYLMHFFFAFVSRMWDMGIVLLVAQLTNNSLFLVAVTGLCCALSIFLFMGTIGSFLDKTNRIVAVRIALLVKLTAVSVAYGVCAYLNITSTSDPIADAEALYNDPFKRRLVYSLPVLAAIAGMSFCAITQSIEKDWIVVLSDKDSRWLSTTNSFTTQIDLGCSSLAPALTGLMFAYQSHEVVSLVLLGVNAASVVALYVFMSHLYNAWPALGQKVGVDEIKQQILEMTHHSASDLESLPDSAGNDFTAAVGSYGTNQDKKPDSKAAPVTAPAAVPATAGGGSSNSVSSMMCSMHDFFHSGCAGMMISYAFLYMTVLSFGSLMTVYTRYCGVSDDRIGLFRGLSALFGYLGATIFPLCSEKLGLHNAAQGAIVYQFLLVALAASSFFWAKDTVSVYIVIFAVLFSRTGLWLFDLCVRQIAQETIPEAVRGKVNGQWRSMIAFFEMSAYAIAAYIPAPEDFWILTTISGAMVGLALITFTLTNPHYSR